MNVTQPTLMLAVAMTALLTSCATSRVEYIDAQVAPAIANPGTVVVAGIVARDSSCVLSQSEQEKILFRLEKNLSQKRRKKEVMSHVTFEGLVGRTRSVGSGSSGSISYVLTPGQVSRAKKIRAQFALVIVVKSGETWCDVDESCTHHEEPIYDKEGNVVGCRHWTEYTTTSRAHRSMHADYLLYDLSNGKKVWACSSKHNEANSRSACSQFGYPLPPPHPAPPTVADVMDNMSNSAMRKFPRPGTRF